MAKIDWALRTEAAAVAAARENAPFLECVPGSYERDHLGWDEYAASSAVDALDTEVIDELQRFSALDDFELETKERAIRKVINAEFFDPYVRELRKLRPDLRECGDDGEEEDGMRGLGAAHGSQNAREDEDSLVTGMAWWMWASQYASAWEEAYDAGEAPRPPWAGGGDINDHTPDVPDEILEGARKILRAALARAGIDAEQVMDVALREDEDYLSRGDRGQQAHEFGEWLGGSWLGAGNAGSYQAIQALKDEHGFDIGDGELALFLVDGDPETVEINYFSGTGLSARGR